MKRFHVTDKRFRGPRRWPNRKTLHESTIRHIDGNHFRVFGSPAVIAGRARTGHHVPLSIGLSGVEIRKWAHPDDRRHTRRKPEGAVRVRP